MGNGSVTFVILRDVHRTREEKGVRRGRLLEKWKTPRPSDKGGIVKGMSGVEHRRRRRCLDQPDLNYIHKRRGVKIQVWRGKNKGFLRVGTENTVVYCTQVMEKAVTVGSSNKKTQRVTKSNTEQREVVRINNH